MHKINNMATKTTNLNWRNAGHSSC